MGEAYAQKEQSNCITGPSPKTSSTEQSMGTPLGDNLWALARTMVGSCHRIAHSARRMLYHPRSPSAPIGSRFCTEEQIARTYTQTERHSQASACLERADVAGEELGAAWEREAAAHADKRTHGARVEYSAHRSQPTVMNEHCAVHELNAVGVAGGDDGLELCDVKSCWLLKENGLASIGSFDGPLSANCSRQGNVNSVDVF